MSGSPESLFQNITHILVDEAHERAKENDFLLTSIKEHFDANPKLKLIIMSATMVRIFYTRNVAQSYFIVISFRILEFLPIILVHVKKFRSQRNNLTSKRFISKTSLK